MRRAPLVLLTLVLTLLAARPAAVRAQPETAAGPEPIVITDLLRLATLGDVAVSPSGREVLYTVTTIEATPEAERPYAYRTHVWLADGSGRMPPRPLTRGPESARDPAWHPDGDRVAFVRRVDGTPQVFVLPLDGGEPYPVTDFEHGAARPRWSPDGTRLLFSASLAEADLRRTAGAPPWPSERPGGALSDTAGVAPDPDGDLRAIQAWLARNADDGSPRVVDRLDLQGEFDLEPGLEVDHLYVIDVRGDTLGVPRALTSGWIGAADGTWTPDGEAVVFAASPVADRHPDRVRARDLYRVDADGGNRRRLLRAEGRRLGDPQVAPDGSAVAFLAEDVDDPGYAQTELGIVPIGGGAARWLTDEVDRSVSSPRWSREGWHVYFTAPSDGGVPLYRVEVFDVPAPSSVAVGMAVAVDSVAADSAAVEDAPALGDTAEILPGAGSQVERLTGYDAGVRSYDVGRASLFYVRTDAGNPYELHALRSPYDRTDRLTAHNHDWIATKRIVRPEARTVVHDGRAVPYWLIEPAGREEGRRYPLLVQMHGGPSAMWGPGEASMWFEFQYFAARGYGVVYANPRGSGGYGYDYQRANFQDWGAGPAGDVLAAASEAADEPWVDPAQQVLTGGSYAGYLTAWIVGHDDRFRAAAAQRGVYDLATFLGEGNAWRLVPSHFGGYPWEAEPAGAPSGPGRPAPDVAGATDTVATDTVAASPAETGGLVPSDSVFAPGVEPPPAFAEEAAPETVREVLLRNSPLTFVDRITTPLLILHADQDLRTGVIGSEMLYKSLKILGRPVEYVRYPDAGHDLSRTGDPAHRMDRILRMYAFFERFL